MDEEGHEPVFLPAHATVAGRPASPWQRLRPLSPSVRPGLRRRVSPPQDPAPTTPPTCAPARYAAAGQYQALHWRVRRTVSPPNGILFRRPSSLGGRSNRHRFVVATLARSHGFGITVLCRFSKIGIAGIRHVFRICRAARRIRRRPCFRRTRHCEHSDARPQERGSSHPEQVARRRACTYILLEENRAIHRKYVIRPTILTPALPH